MKRFLFLIVVISLFSNGLVLATKPKYITKENISYRENESDAYKASRCKLDINYPETEGFATIIWYHGGGLTSGQKHIPDGLREKGFAVVAVNYRLAPKVKVADCVDDAAAAAAWVVNHIAEYGGDPKKIFVSGHSAGGYLTSMIGLDKRWLKPYGVDPDTAFVALIPYSGQVVTHFSRRKELGIPSNKPIVDDMAPLNHVRPDCPPILILSGDREMEMLGRYEENAYFWRMMKVAGHKDVQIKEFDGYNHGNMYQAGDFVTVRYIQERLKALDNKK